MKKFGDWPVALTVVACSVVLLLALTFALQGNPFDRPSRTLRAHFIDITGIQTSSIVKFGGAPAGTVHTLRILTPEERLASATPENTVEIVIALDPDTPPLSPGLVASVSSDTLLSDKFVLLSGGDPQRPALANDALVASIPPVTFDAILRDLGGVLATMRGFLDPTDSGVERLLPLASETLTQLGAVVTDIKTLLGSGTTLLTDAGTMVRSGDALLRDGHQLVRESAPSITKLLDDLAETAQSLDALTQRADALIKDNQPNIDASTAEARAMLRELKLTAASAHALVDQLRARPQSLLFGPGRPPKEPAE